MSVEWQTIMWTYAMVTVAVFVCASLALNDGSVQQKDKVWVGRIGLAAPLWPVSALVGLVVVFMFAVNVLRKASRGKR